MPVPGSARPGLAGNDGRAIRGAALAELRSAFGHFGFGSPARL